MDHHQQQTYSPVPSTAEVPAESVVNYHTYSITTNQCCSAVIQSISAPVSTVWSLVRRFEKPQIYKTFIKSCDLVGGNGEVGTVRKVRIISGLPATNSRERLEVLDNEKHVISFSAVGGKHRLVNYRSVTTLHSDSSSPSTKTIVVESYVVDVPAWNTKEETCFFVDTIIKCNMKSLAHLAATL